MSNELETVLTVDAETGEQSERPMTAEELAEREIMTAEYAQRKAESQAKIEARQSALAKLAALGLTEEEVEAL
jgi:hypothetical protein